MTYAGYDRPIMLITNNTSDDDCRPRPEDIPTEGLFKATEAREDHVAAQPKQLTQLTIHNCTITN